VPGAAVRGAIGESALLELFLFHHRGTEHTEVAQRNSRPPCFLRVLCASVVKKEEPTKP